MDVFKELIDELKEENLLEQTVVNSEPKNSETESFFVSTEFPAPAERPSLEIAANDVQEESIQAVLELDHGTIDRSVSTSTKGENCDFDFSVSKPKNGREFYKKRAVGEMSHLQMVEHVLTGVEREYMKIVPKPFDDFAAKKALNAFLKISEGENSLDSGAELAMMDETEAWCTALAERDRVIPVASLRQYCENSRPALSSQALVALARFYRNMPYSEAVRSKFDFVITRLFSRSIPGNKRICLFTREEALSHLSLLYKEWSSVPLYTADEDESKVLLTALSFEELANEAENASSFDLLVANDFFGRLGMFKESVSELFFAPNVSAAAIDCNIRVGNAYVTLIDNERVKMDSQSMYSKFGAVDNSIVSDAAARTLEIVDILRKQRDYSLKSADLLENLDRPVSQNDKSDGSPYGLEGAAPGASWRDRFFKKRAGSGGPFVKRWLLGAAVLLIVVSAGIFAWATFLSPQQTTDASARTIELPNSVLRQHLKTVRISGPNFYGLLLPSWGNLSKEKREEFIKVVFDFAKEKGCSQVSLLDSEGKAAGSVSPSKIEVIME